MKLILTLLSLAFALALPQLHAQAPLKKPGPEHERLAVFKGKWKCQATSVNTPFGPARTEDLTSANRFINGGFHLEMRGKDRAG